MGFRPRSLPCGSTHTIINECVLRYIALGNLGSEFTCQGAECMAHRALMARPTSHFSHMARAAFKRTTHPTFAAHGPRGLRRAAHVARSAFKRTARAASGPMFRST